MKLVVFIELIIVKNTAVNFDKSTNLYYNIYINRLRFYRYNRPFKKGEASFKY
jgi:hypothetical protein